MVYSFPLQSPGTVTVRFMSIVPLVMNAVRVQNARGRWKKKGDVMGVNGDDSSAYALCCSVAAWLHNETSCRTRPAPVFLCGPLCVYVAALLWRPGAAAGILLPCRGLDCQQ